MKSTSVSRIFLLLYCLLMFACHQQDEKKENTHAHGPGYADWVKGPSSDPLAPADALKTFVVQDQLTIDLIGSEPLVQDPVAISFDAQGRIWVAEMTNYMLDIAGTGETEPNGNIVILEDTNGDNKPDQRTVFLSNIALPRAIAHVKGGILFADNQGLYFVVVVIDPTDGSLSAGRPVIVDKDYARGSNVEKKANGLLYGLDNWLYSAFSNQRYRTYPLDSLIETGSEEIYRTQNWKLVRATTEYRGQWGITQDDFGRLFYNHNSILLIADSVPANTRARNPKIKFRNNGQEQLSDRKVYPSRPTPGINRAYKPNALDKNGRMIGATAASGPVIYRGTSIPHLYGHAITPEPGGNLVNAMRISEDDGVVIGKPFYFETELLTSTDERFRPVNTYTGPDGGIYIVDMYRGILQDRFYLTQYLADYILGKKLNEGVHMGRIYRITGEGETSNEPFNLQRMDGHDLIQQLSHRNAWRRDTARRLLIERQDKSTIRDLLMLVQTGKTIAIQLNALWTLEGLDALTPFLLSGLLTSPSNKIKSHCILLAKKLDQTEQAVFIAQLVEQKLIETPSYEVAMALSAALGQFQDQLADELLEGLLTRWPNNTTIQSLALSGLYGREQSFIDQVKVTSLKGDLSALITLPEPINAAKTHLNKEDFATYVRGQQVYGTAGCAGCHGEHGEGQNFSGPPLAGSEWVTGSPMRLCAILLHGVTGPMHVADSLYNPGTDMPGLKNNNSVSLAEIAALIAYLRNSWGNRGNLLSIEAAYKVNELTSDQRGPFTEAELIQMFDD